MAGVRLAATFELPDSQHYPSNVCTDSHRHPFGIVSRNHAAVVREVNTNQRQGLPLGAYDPDPAKTLLSALDAHRVMHPDMVGADFTTSRTRSHDADQGDIRHEAVMARESVLGRDAFNPWGEDANDWGDRKSTEDEAASPNGW